MRHSPPLLITLATLAALPLLAAGCGSNSHTPGVASIHATTTTTRHSGAVAYAACMRSRGVVNFPDPNSSGEFEGSQIKGVRVSISVLRAADGVCIHLLGPGGLRAFVAAPPRTAQQTRTHIADELSFAGCMRSHGVPRFPDPTAHGDLSVQMVQAQGIDVHSAAVLRVVYACLPASHGALTPAQVRQALHDAGH
jgi:hypothetical protein